VAFTLPNFNIACNIWAPGDNPGDGDPPTFSDVPCQLYTLSRTGSLPSYMLRLDKSFAGLELHAGTTLSQGSGFVLSSMAGHFFGCLTRPFVVHSGFPNEYWAVMLIETDDDFVTQHTPNELP